MRLSAATANAPRPAERDPRRRCFGRSGTLPVVLVQAVGSAVPASCGPVVPSRKSCGRHEPAGRPVAVVVPVRVGAGWRLAELLLRGGRGCAGAGRCRVLWPGPKEPHCPVAVSGGWGGSPSTIPERFSVVAVSCGAPESRLPEPPSCSASGWVEWLGSPVWRRSAQAGPWYGGCRGSKTRLAVGAAGQPGTNCLSSHRLSGG
jgi:hypothetical protein